MSINGGFMKKLLYVVVLLVLVGCGVAHAEDAIHVQTATVDGLKLNYLTAGSGDTVLLLHGYAETSRMWRPIIPQLAKRFQVIAPDLPGIGDSAIPTDG